jgi:hypothetical protein
MFSLALNGYLKPWVADPRQVALSGYVGIGMVAVSVGNDAIAWKIIGKRRWYVKCK